MSLATRLSAFFLATLAAVLVCFSAAIYLFQRWSLAREADARLAAELRLLVASIEIEPDGIEWNPREHRLDARGRRVAAGGPAALHWRVTDDAGNVVDETPGFAEIGAGPLPGAEGRPVVRPGKDGPWLLLSDRVTVEEALASAPVEPPTEPDPDEEPEYPALTVTAAVSTAGLRGGLNRLAVALAALSAGIWAVAALGGGRLARRALRPLTEMAAVAAGADATSPARLPVPDTGDEVAALGRAFNGLLDRLREAFDRERRFTAEASHQLRTPLAALLGQIDVALRRERPAGEYREALVAARGQADRLRRIVDALLALARSEAEPAARVEPFALGDWLPGYLRAWSGHARAADLRVENGADPAAEVAADPELLGQLLDVLIDNALKYSPAGTPVVVRVAEAGRAVEVEDRGPGIPDGEAGDVFRPFHRGEEAQRRGVEGLGLGLALARRIADRIGAAIGHDRPPGGGCRFRVRLKAGGGEGSRAT